MRLGASVAVCVLLPVLAGCLDAADDAPARSDDAFPGPCIHPFPCADGSE